MADDTVATLAGRIRAIEAILLEMPELTSDLVDNAKVRIRKSAGEGSPDDLRRSTAKLKASSGMPLDEEGEKALDEIASKLAKRRR